MNTSGQKCGQTCLKGNGVSENSNVATTELLKGALDSAQCHALGGQSHTCHPER